MAKPILKKRKVASGSGSTISKVVPAREATADTHSSSSEDSFTGFGSDSDSDHSTDDDDSMDTSEDEQTPAPSKPKKRARPSSDATQLSSAAMAALSTGGSQSRLLKLQLSSRLDEVKAPPKRRTDIDSFLRRLKNVIEPLPAREPIPILEAERALNKIAGTGAGADKKGKKGKSGSSGAESVVIPFPEPRPGPDSKLQVAFAPPQYVDVVGSYVGGTYRVQSSSSSSSLSSTRSKSSSGDTRDKAVSVDMVVCMPTSLFQEKDYLNYRYAYKRAYYLAVLAKGIKDSEIGKEKGVQICFEGWRGNMLQPVIVVRVKPRSSPSSSLSSSEDNNKKANGGVDKPFEVTIVPVLQTPPPFPLQKLSLDNGNIRSHPSPTPVYNSTILLDCAIGPVTGILRHAAEMSPNFTEACLLGRLWLQKHGFGGDIAFHGFGGAEWALLQATLIGAAGDGKPSISPGCSTLQMFRAILNFLASRDLGTHPYGIPKPNGSESTNSVAPKSKPVFVLPGIGLNVLFKMSCGGYDMLRRAATDGVRKLVEVEKNGGSQSVDVADALWGQPTTRASAFSVGQYDLVVRLNLDGAESLDRSSKTAESGALDRYTLFVSNATFMQSILSRGLADRSRRVDVLFSRSRPWPLSNQSPFSTDSFSSSQVTFGISVNPATAERLVDLGPFAEEKADAAAFRDFWGDKAELRRFKDGSIRESCVWSDRSGERVVEQVCRYLVEKYAGVQALEGLTIDGGVDVIAEFSASSASAATAGATFQPILNAFQELHASIRELDTAETLPLRVRSFAPADEQLRYSSVLGPDESSPVPADVVLQFEFSPRWPDDLEAIQRTKMAFLLKVGECLTERDDSYTSRLGLENFEAPIQNQGFLDVKTPTGFVFRLRIQHEREEELLMKTLSTKSTPPPVARAAAEALAAYRTLYLRRPRHTTAVASAATRFPALSETVRLLKFWFSKHGLLPHFAPELVEILAVNVFTSEGEAGGAGGAEARSSGGDVPGTGVAGFLRVLDWLSTWDWRKQYAVVRLTNEDSDDSGAGPAATGATAGSGSIISSSALSDERAQKRAERAKEIATRFRSWRSIDPSLTRLALFVATDVDPDGAAWTEGGKPAVVVASRMTMLARAAVAKLAQAAIRAAKLSDDGEGNAESNNHHHDDDDDDLDNDFEAVFASLFEPKWKGYDFVFHLDPKTVHDPDSEKKKKDPKPGQFKNLVLAAAAATAGLTGPSVPEGQLAPPSLSSSQLVTAFVAEVEDTFGPVFVLFWDPLDGDRIGGIWNPGYAGKARRWKPRIGFSTAPVGGGDGTGGGGDEDGDEDMDSGEEGAGKNASEQGQVVLNKSAILAEIWRLGGDMIKKVDGLGR